MIPRNQRASTAAVLGLWVTETETSSSCASFKNPSISHIDLYQSTNPGHLPHRNGKNLTKRRHVGAATFHDTTSKCILMWRLPNLTDVFVMNLTFPRTYTYRTTILFGRGTSSRYLSLAPSCLDRHQNRVERAKQTFVNYLVQYFLRRNQDLLQYAHLELWPLRSTKSSGSSWVWHFVVDDLLCNYHRMKSKHQRYFSGLQASAMHACLWLSFVCSVSYSPRGKETLQNVRRKTENDCFSAFFQSTLLTFLLSSTFSLVASLPSTMLFIKKCSRPSAFN